MRAIISAILVLAATPALAETKRGIPAKPSILVEIKRFEQIALTTADLPRAIQFYRDEIGLPLLFESNGMAFFDVGGIRLMIAIDAKRSMSRRPQSILYFQVADFGDAVKRLQNRSIKLVGPVETVQTTSNADLKLQQFEDRDGNALAVIRTVTKL